MKRSRWQIRADYVLAYQLAIHRISIRMGDLELESGRYNALSQKVEELNLAGTRHDQYCERRLELFESVVKSFKQAFDWIDRTSARRAIYPRIGLEPADNEQLVAKTIRLAAESGAYFAQLPQRVAAMTNPSLYSILRGCTEDGEIVLFEKLSVGHKSVQTCIEDAISAFRSHVTEVERIIHGGGGRIP